MVSNAGAAGKNRRDSKTFVDKKNPFDTIRVNFLSIKNKLKNAEKISINYLRN